MRGRGGEGKEGGGKNRPTREAGDLEAWRTESRQQKLRCFVHRKADPRELRNKQMRPTPKRDPLACATGGGSLRKARGFSGGTPTTNSAPIHTHQPSYESLPFLPHSGI